MAQIYIAHLNYCHNHGIFHAKWKPAKWKPDFLMTDLGLGYCIGLPLIVIAMIFHKTVIGFYTDNQTIIQATWPPFVIMLLNYVFALPGYVYMNAVTGTGATRTTFIFQTVTIIAYLSYLWGISHWDVPLAVYWTVEYLFVICLGLQSVIYLKLKKQQYNQIS